MRSSAGEHEVLSRARKAMCGARENAFAVLEVVAEIDVDGTGYPSTERLLEDLLHIDRRDAKRLVRHAAALIARTALSGQALPPRAPATAAAHAGGEVGPAHVDVVLDALDRLARVPGLAPELLAEAEETLAEAATYLPPRALSKVAARLIATLDPDGAAPDDEPAPADELHVGTRRGGGLTGTFRFHATADGELIREALDALSAPAGPDDPRSLATRQAEAFLDLVAQAVSPTGVAAGPAAPDGTSAAAPEPVRALGRGTLVITMDLDALRAGLGHGRLDSEHATSPETARRLACDAGVVPMVLGSRSEPLDVGRLSYTVPEGMRRALSLRDGGCSFPGCTRRPGRCAAHHVVHWADGGPTALHNLTLLCRFHHRMVHHDQWRIRMCDGRPWFVPPRWIDPAQTPRPG